MANPFEVVKDSSIWQSKSNFSTSKSKDNSLRIGVVKKVYLDPSADEIRYLVDVRDKSDSIEMNCRMLRRFGGVFNYEDTIYHGYKFTDRPDQVQSFDTKAGDAVLVGFLNGEGREAIILGGVMHSARSSTLDITQGPQYASEFNGVKTEINQNGEYILTFRGIPTNSAILNSTPNLTLPAPTYNTTVGTSFFKLDQTGSMELNDNSTSGVQNLRIDKSGGFIIVNAGAISLKMTKSSQEVDLLCKVLNITSSTSITQTTQTFRTEASTSATVKSPKIALGTDSIELLDQLFQLIDALGTIITISPVGPCDPLSTTGQWSAVTAIQSKIKQITGSI